MKSWQNRCKIIHHTQFIKSIPVEKLSEEYVKQETLIEEFFDATEKADKEWKNNQNSINKFWTGLS
jgi:hypothetical protein